MIEQMFLTKLAVDDIIIMVPLGLKQMVTDGLPFTVHNCTSFPFYKGG